MGAGRALGAALGLALGACSPSPSTNVPNQDVVAVPATASGSAPTLATMERPPGPAPSAPAAGGGCRSDADCVPAQCCHPTSCVVASEAPKCEGAMCTRDCRGGSFECGAGACACQAGVCAVDWRTKPRP